MEARAGLQKRLEGMGLNLERITELDENKLFDILRGEPRVVFEIQRTGISGREEWILDKGEAVGIKIYDKQGKVEAEVTDKDAAEIAKKLDEEPAVVKKAA